MEENNNINKKKNYPSIPSNFVTLLQLQEKWIKEKEKQKQPQQQQLKVEEQPIKSRRNYRNTVGRNYRKTVEKAVVANVSVVENESTEKEVNSEELSSSSSSKNKKKKKKKKKEETESRAKEEEVKEGDAHAPPPVSTEKENVSVRSVWLKKGMRSEFRPKINNVAVVQSEDLESESAVEIDRKFRDLSVKQSEGLESGSAVEVERKFRDLSVKQSEGSKSGSVVEVERKFRDLSMNNRSEGVRNDRLNRGVRRDDWGYRVGGGGGYGRHGIYRGERKMRSGAGGVWVKKGEITDANVDGNQSSSSSVKELK